MVSDFDDIIQSLGIDLDSLENLRQMESIKVYLGDNGGRRAGFDRRRFSRYKGVWDRRKDVNRRHRKSDRRWCHMNARILGQERRKILYSQT